MKPVTPKLLRGLILVEAVCFVVGSLLPDKSFPPEIQACIARTNQLPQSSYQQLSEGVGFLLLAGMFISWIGLWNLWPPAKWLYSICWLLGLSLYGLMEPVYYYDPSGAVLNEGATLAGGAILALLHVSSLSVRFSSKVHIPPVANVELGDNH